MQSFFKEENFLLLDLGIVELLLALLCSLNLDTIMLLLCSSFKLCISSVYLGFSTFSGYFSSF